MATKKAEGNPHFPNPPLEVGVAQYPTPLVPNYNDKTGGWSINDQGHIILVEKVSIEKGSYNPQPLDGSITYTKRDANKWPSPLYLVFQRPEETGQFVYNYWANDRTLASQDPWNYGVSYSTENPAFPIYTRAYITPRSQYSAVSLGSVDPVFGGTAIIAKQQMQELAEDNPLRSRYVQVQRVYESIPSAVLTGKKLDERGDIETITTQVVVAGTAPASDGLLVTKTAVEPVDSVKSTKTYGSVDSYATLTTKAKKSGLLGLTSTTDDIVAPTTNPDALSTTVLESTVEAISATKSRKRTTTSSGPTALDGKTIGEFGLITTEESIVVYGSSLPIPTQNTVKLDQTPVDLAKAKLTNAKYDDLSTLTGYQYDADLNLIVTNTKEMVAAGASAPSITNGLLSSRDEIIDKWKTVRIQSKIASLPANRTEYKTGAYASPNLVYGFNTDVAQLPNWDLKVTITPVMRAKRSYQTVFKHVTSYVYGTPNPTPAAYTLYDPVSINLFYDGYFIKIKIDDALTDSSFTPLSFTTASNDPVHGYINETYYVPASAESATAYLGKVGSYQLIAYEIDYWKANIWRVSEQWVLLK